MKYTSLLLLFVYFFQSAQAQNEDRLSFKNYFDRGSKALNLQIGVAGGYPFNSVTELDITKDNKRYGLLALPSFGYFVERNFMIGASAVVGFTRNTYSNNSYNYSVNPPVPTNYKFESNGIDMGIAPFLRYYVPIGKRNIVSLFGQGSVPVVYTRYKTESTPPQNYPNNYYYSYNDEESVKLLASLGLGVSVNGRFGSLEVNANNTGLYLGFQKYLFAKKR